MTIGDLIRKYREENNLTMDEFVKGTKLTKGYISMLENNKNPNTGKPIKPSLEKIKTIAERMSIDLTGLLESIDPDFEVNLIDEEIHTFAAHKNNPDEEWTKEELEEIERFKEFVKLKRKSDKLDNK